MESKRRLTCYRSSALLVALSFINIDRPAQSEPALAITTAAQMVQREYSAAPARFFFWLTRSGIEWAEQLQAQ